MKGVAADTRPASNEGDVIPAKRPWVRPVVVEYGHLAKLTRGTSGAISEFATKKAMCL